MKIPIYQVDAFTDKLFGGNAAAVTNKMGIEISLNTQYP